MQNEGTYILGISPPPIELNKSQESNCKIIWSNHETDALITAVESHYHDTQNLKKKALFWSTISEELKSQGIEFSDHKCHRKWLNLVRSYKVAKDTKTRTGRGPVKFMYYDRLDRLLGDSRLTIEESNNDCQSTYIKVENDDYNSMEFESHFTVENHDILLTNSEENDFENAPSSSEAINPIRSSQNAHNTPEKSPNDSNSTFRPIKRKTNIFLERQMELMRLKRRFFEHKLANIKQKETMRNVYVKENLKCKQEKLALYKRRLEIEEEKVKVLTALKDILDPNK